MPSRSALFVRAAMLLADSASMFAGFAILGFIARHGTSPLSWPVILAILTAGTLAFYVVQRFRSRGAAQLVPYGLAGLVVAYAAAAGMAGLDWLGTLLQGGMAASEAVGAGLAFLAGGFLWLHAASLAVERELGRRLVRRFRFGMAWFVIAFILEVGSGRDLQVEGLLLPFLVAALSALAVNRFGGGIGASTFRLKLAAFMVLFVVGFGAVAGAVGDSVGRGVWSVLAAIFSWPLEALRDGYLWVVGAIFQPIIGDDSAFRDGAGDASSLEELGRFGQHDLGASLLDIEWQGWATLAIALFLGYLIYRFYIGPSDDLDEKQRLDRERIDDSIPFVGDALRFVRGMASRRGDRFRHPMPPRTTGSDGQRAAFELYRHLVTVACDRGHAFDEADTPNERDRRRAFPNFRSGRG